MQGTSGAVAKLLALPTCCIAIIASRLLHHGLTRIGLPVLRPLITLKVVLLSPAAALAVAYGPFADVDAPRAILTGILLVSAMVIQNAVHRVHLSKEPPSTIMTGTSTQIMLDVADTIVGLPPDHRVTVRGRLCSMSSAVTAFATGCTLAAAGYVVLGEWCLAVPPILTLPGLLEEPRPPGESGD